MSRPRFCSDAISLVGKALLAISIAVAGSTASGNTVGAEVSSYEDAVREASIAFAEGDYSGARRHLVRAYGIHRDPVLLFNIASSFRRENKRSEAVHWYEKFLEEAGDGHPKAELARKTISELRDEPPESPLLPPAIEEPAAVEHDDVGVPADLLVEPGPDRANGDEPGGWGTLQWAGTGLMAGGALGLVVAILDSNRSDSAGSSTAAVSMAQPPGKGKNEDKGDELDPVVEDVANIETHASRRPLVIGAASGAAIIAGAILHVVAWKRSHQASVSISASVGRTSNVSVAFRF